MQTIKKCNEKKFLLLTTPYNMKSFQYTDDNIEVLLLKDGILFFELSFMYTVSTHFNRLCTTAAFISRTAIYYI